MIAFIVIALIAVYFFVGGVVYSQIQDKMRPHCQYKGSLLCDGGCGHSILAGLSVVAWPVALPVMLGIVSAGADRSESRRKKEIAKAEHEVEIAKLQAQKTAILEHEVGIR